MNVFIYEEDDHKALQILINERLKEHRGIEIVDIKYSTSQCVWNDSVHTKYSALVMWKLSND